MSPIEKLDDIERLGNSHNIIYQLPENFDFVNGVIQIQPLGSFSLAILDPNTGEMIDGPKAIEIIRASKKVVLYYPNQNVGDSVFIFTSQRVSVSDTGMMYKMNLAVFTTDGWKNKSMGPTSIVQMNSTLKEPLISLGK